MNTAQSFDPSAVIKELRTSLNCPKGYETWAEYENARAWNGFDVNQRLALIRLAGFERFGQFGIKGQDAIQTLSKTDWLDLPQATRSQLIAGSKRAKTIEGLRH